MKLHPYQLKILEAVARGEAIDVTIGRSNGKTTVLREMEKVRQAAATWCVVCNNTGDVSELDGSWRGRCTCPAGRALLPWTPTDIRLSNPPCDGDARIDVRFRDGAIVRGAQAYTWAWGEAGGGTITYWRMMR